MTILFLLIGIIPVAVILVITYTNSKSNYEDLAYNELSAILSLKKKNIEKYFEDRFKLLDDVKMNLRFIQGIPLFSKAYNEGLNSEEYQNLVITRERGFEIFMKNFGFDDVYLINSIGRVVYTVGKQSDLGVNLNDNNWENNGLGRVFSASRNDNAFIDFEWYEPTNEAASFIGTPIHSKNGEYIGNAVFKISLKDINNIMQFRTGSFQSEDTYLVGSDKRMRSDTYLDPVNHNVKASFEGTIENNGIDTKAIREALAGRKGKDDIIDFRGNEVLLVYSPIDLPNDIKWAMVAQIDKHEALKAASSTLLLSIIMLIIFVGLIALISVLFSKSISNRIYLILDRMKSLSNICINNLAKGSEQLSNGDLNINIKTGTPPLVIDSNDEIGQIAENMNKIISDIKVTANSVEKSVIVIKDTVDEINLIVESSINGDLFKRGNERRFNGSFKELINGLNNTLEAFNKPIEEQKLVLEKLSSGDLTARMVGNYKGDFLNIKESVNSLAISFSNALSDVKNAVDATASASTQISSSSEELAAGVQEQSSQTAEIASAVEEMTKTILQTSEHAISAAEQSKDAGETAKNGGYKITATVEGMQRIAKVVTDAANTIKKLGANSEKIGAIVEVIDDIADQTNLLALNAAIEAARAGEHGRGFAVVADEVRKLAERTTNATGEIGSMISNIQQDTNEAVKAMGLGTEEVNKGIMLADQSGSALNEIIDNTEKVLDTINQVAVASEEESATAEQISRSIEGINSVSQETATGIQQIAEAAEDLSNLTL
ncbi:MAG: methyl-accepting chemotaxis protein, partial [Candidatus Nanoarchaeia archaeon]